jgi:tetratricopeptide (TPR) repeat protein
VYRRSLSWPLAWGVALAVAGAVFTYYLAGGPWALAGAVIGAVTGSFAPSVYDDLRRRHANRNVLDSTVELTVPRSWTRLLDPRLEVVQFVGRDEELTNLLAWCEDDNADRLRLLTGPGGVGKTRLSIELASRLDELGWITERIADGKEADSIEAVRAVTQRRVMLVVDYAETRLGLKQMLAALASPQGGGIRVLLLARSTGDWWDQLGAGEPAVWDLLQSARRAVIPLSPPVAAYLEDADIVALAVRSFARTLGLPEKMVEIYGDTNRRRMLELHAAALAALLRETDSSLSRIHTRGVLGELLRHEQRFWYESAQTYGLLEGPQGATIQMLRQLVAVCCLLGAATESDALALPARVPGMSSAAKFAAWSRVLYPPDPGEADWIGTLQPDRLAELHTIRELTESQVFAQTCLTNLDARQAHRAVAFLARASSDYPEAEALLSEVLPSVANFIADVNVPLETLTAIFNAIPSQSAILAPPALAICQRIISLLPTDTSPEIRAQWSFKLGLWLLRVGRLSEALIVMQATVVMFRELVTTDDWNYSYLAGALSNLGTVLLRLDRPDEALPAAQEAVEIRRGIRDVSNIFDGLPTALSNLGIVLAEAGRPMEALAATQEAADMYGGWMGEDSRYRLAVCLYELGVRYLKLGRPEDALPVGERSVELLREFAVSDPKYRVDLARALNYLSASLGVLSRPETLPVVQEAIDICRELAAENPELFSTDLARSLLNLGMQLSLADRPIEALAAAEESVQLYQPLASKNPGGYGVEFAKSILSLAERLAEANRFAEALPFCEEALQIFRRRTADNHASYRPELAAALHSLNVLFSDLDRASEALPLAEEEVQIYRELAAENLGAYRGPLAMSLQNLGFLLYELDRPSEALPPTEEGVEIQRELAAENLGAYRGPLAMSLFSLGLVLYELDRFSEALPLTEETVWILRELAAENPGTYREQLAGSLHLLSDLLTELKFDTAADAARDEAEKLVQRTDQ